MPAQPVISEFPQVSPTQWVLDIPNPSSINLLTFALTSALPEGTALALSWSLPPFNTIEFLGAVANERPTDTFHASWSFNPAITSSPVLRLTLSLENIANIQELVLNKSSTDVRQTYAKKVALNLFRFMESFNRNTDMYQGVMVLPVDVLDKWYLKFENKFKYDPFFVLNTE